MASDQYSTLIADWMDGNRDPEAIKAALKSGDTPALLNAIRRTAEDAKSREELGTIMLFFANVIETIAGSEKNPLVSGDLYQVAAKTRQRIHDDQQNVLDAIAQAASRSLNPITAEQMLSMGRDVLPKDVMEGILKYVVQAHPDPKIRKKYLNDLKELEEKEDKTRKVEDAVSTLKTAEPGSKEAEEAARQVLGNVPVTAQAEKALEAAMAAAKAGFVAMALEFLEGRLSVDGISDKQKATLFRGMGDVGMLQDAASAAAYYEKALELEPKDVDALVGLAQVHKAEQRWDDALALLRKGITMTAGKPQEAAVLMGLADILKALEQWDQAEKYARRVRSLNPRNKDAIIFYEDYYTAKEDWQRLYATLQFHLSMEKDPAERVKLTRRLSDMAMEKMGNKGKAMDILKRLVLMDPADKEARERLSRIYEETGKWRALVELYNDIVRKLPASEADQKVELLKKMVNIYEDKDKLNNPDMALNTYARVVQLVPDDAEALNHLAEGYRRRGNWSELLMVLKQQADSETDPEKQLKLSREIVDIALGKLSNERLALPYLERIYELDPQNTEILENLVSAYEHKREYEKLLDVLRRLIPLTEGKDREKLLYKAAITAKDRLGRNDEALDYYEGLYQANNTLREVREILHQLYPKLDEWERYANFLEEEITRPMPDRRRVELLGKLGEIRLEKLDDPNGARELFEKALEIQPHDVLSQRKLEQIYITLGDFDALKDSLRNRGQLRGYVNMLSELEMQEEDTDRKVKLALEMARTCEEDLGDKERAIRYYDRAYTLSPHLTDVGMRLVEYYSKRGQTEREIEILSRLVEHAEDIGLERQTRQRLFKLLSMEGRAEEAFEHGKAAIELAVSMGDTPEILDAFSEVAKSVEKWPEYADLLMAVAAVSGPDRKVSLLLEVAEIYRDRMDDLDAAVSTLMGILDVNPKHDEALAALEEIAFQREDYRSLERVYQRQLNVEDSPARQVQIYLKLGGLYEEFLNDDEAATEAYNRALILDAGNRAALSGLHRSYEKQEQYHELVQVLRKEIDAAEQVAQKNLFRLELARILLEAIGDTEGAAKVAMTALSEEPDNSKALDFLLEMHGNPDTRPALADSLPALLQQVELWGPMETVLLQQADEDALPQKRAELFEQVARLRQEKLDNLDGAVDVLLLAARAFPSASVIRLLVELGTKNGREEEVAQALATWAEGGQEIALDKETETLINRQLAGLYEGPLNNLQGAAECYERLAALNGDTTETLEKIADLYRKQAYDERLLETLTRLQKVVPVDQAGPVVSEAVDLAQKKDDYDTAVQVLRDYVYARPADLQLAARLEGIYEEQGDKDALYDYLVWFNDQIEDPQVKADNLYKLAVLRLEHLEDYASVVPTLQQVLELDPGREDVIALCERIAFSDNEDWLISMGMEALEILIDAFRKTDRKEDLARCLLKAGELEAGQDRRLELLTEAGDLQRELGQKEAAFQTYRQVFETNPGLSAVGDHLVELGGDLGKAEELVEVMRNAAESATPDIKFSLLVKATRLLWQPLERKDEVERLLKDLYKERPTDPDLLRLYMDFLKVEREPKQRVDFLQQAIKKQGGGQTKRMLLLGLGDALQEAGNIDMALETYNKVIQSRPDPDAMDDQTRVALNESILAAEESGDNVRLFELNFLAGKLEAEPDEKAGRFYAAAQAGLRDDALKDRTIDAYMELLKVWPDRPEIAVEARQAMVRAGKATDARDMLLDAIARGGDTAALKKELARLYTQELGEPEKALELMNGLLAESPDDKDAIDLVTELASNDELRIQALLDLAKVHEATGDWPMLTSDALNLLDQLKQNPGIIKHILHIVDALREAGKMDEAAEVLIGVLRIPGFSEPALGTLADVLEETGRLDALATLLPGISEEAGDADYAADLRTRGAALLMEKGVKDGARDLYRRQVEAMPDDRSSIETLRNLYQELGDYEGVVFTIGMLADLETDADVRMSLLLEGGEIARDQLKDLNLAEAYFMRIFEIEPDSEEAFRALEVLYRAKDDKEALYDLHHREFEALGQSGKSDAWKDAGLVLISEALENNDIQLASQTAVTLIESGHTGRECVSAAREVLFRQEEAPALFELVERSMQQAGNQAELLELYRGAVVNGLKNPSGVDLLRKAIEVEKTLNDKPHLWEDMMALVRETPGDLDAWTQLRQLSRDLGKTDELVAALKDVAEEGRDLEAWNRIVLLLAEVLEKDAGDVESAESYLRIVLEDNPSDPDAFAMMEALLLEAERFVELALLYESGADNSVDPQQRHERYMEAARLYQNTGDPDHAMELMEKCLTLGWKTIDAAKELEKLARETGSMEYRAKALQARFAGEEDPQKRLEQGIQIAELYQSADKTNDAVDIMRLLAQETGYTNMDVVNRLEQLYIKTEHFEELVDLYLSVASAITDREMRLDYLKKAAQLNEFQLQRVDDAVKLLQQVLQEAPTDKFAYSRLLDLLRAEERMEDVEALYRLRLAQDLSEEDRVDVLTDFAKAMVLQDRWDDALDRADEGLKLRPDNEDLTAIVQEASQQEDVTTRLRALGILERIARDSNAYADLADILEIKAGLEEAPDTKRALLVELANIAFSELKDASRAMDFITNALDFGIDEASLGLLEQIGLAEGMTDRYYEALQRVIQNTDDLELAIGLHKKSARIALEHMSDPALAANHYMACLNNDRLEIEEMAQLEKLLGGLERHQDQVMVLKELIRKQGEKKALMYVLKLGDIYQEKLSDPEGALEEYSIALQNMGRVETIEDRLMSLAQDPIVGFRAIEVLKPLAEEDLDFERLSSLIQLQISGTSDPRVQSDLYRELAHVYERTGDTVSQMKALGEAMIRRPESEGLPTDMMNLAGNDPELIKLAVKYLEQVVEKVEWLDVKEDLYVKIAKLSMKVPELKAHVENALNRVLQLDPNNSEAMETLEELYTSENRTEEYIQILEIKISSDAFLGTRVEDLKKLAEFYIAMGRHEDAAEKLQQVLDIRPADVDALSRMLDIEEAADNHERADYIVNQVLALPVDCEGCAELLQRAADFVLFKEGNKNLARKAYEKLWRFNPDDIKVRNQLIDLLKEQDDWNALLSVYDLISDQGQGRDAADAAIQAAELAETRKNNPDQAIRMYMRALEHDPKRTEVVDELIRLYYDAGYWSELVGMLKNKAAMVTGTERTELLLKAVDIAKEKIGDEKLVTQFLRELLQSEPDNVNVMLLLANQLHALRDLEGAEALYKKAIDTDKSADEDKLEALIGLAGIYTDMKVDAKKIKQLAEKALRIDPKDNRAIKLLKNAYIATGDHKNLIKLLEKHYDQISEPQERSAAALDIAKAYLTGLKDEDKFLAWIRSAYNEMPNNPEVVKTLVDYYNSKGELPQARSYLEWLIKYFEKTNNKAGIVKYSTYMGKLLEESGDLTKALQFYIQAFRLVGENRNLRLHIGLLQSKLKRWQDVVKTLQPLLLKLNTMDKESKRSLLLTLARAHKELGEKHKMRQYVLRLLADNPNDAEAEELLSH